MSLLKPRSVTPAGIIKACKKASDMSLQLAMMLLVAERNSLYLKWGFDSLAQLVREKVNMSLEALNRHLIVAGYIHMLWDHAKAGAVKVTDSDIIKMGFSRLLVLGRYSNGYGHNHDRHVALIRTALKRSWSVETLRWHINKLTGDGDENVLLAEGIVIRYGLNFPGTLTAKQHRAANDAVTAAQAITGKSRAETALSMLTYAENHLPLSVSGPAPRVSRRLSKRRLRGRATRLTQRATRRVRGRSRGQLSRTSGSGNKP